MTHRHPLDSDQGQDWETVVQQAARAFPYPPTPDLAARLADRVPLRQRPVRLRRAWIALIALLLAAALWAVPEVRASVRHLLRLGAVQINLDDDTPPVTLPPLVVPGAPGLQGETTLDAARAAVDFPIRLPSYPSDLGAPDHVYLQDFGGPLIVLVWVDPDDPSRARLSLHILGPGVFAGKGAPTSVESTSVDGRPALWTTGPYMLAVVGQRSAMVSLVEGHVLIWEADRLTYRLETNLSLEEARHIAEALK
jgi:hypothetical protein